MDNQKAFSLNDRYSKEKGTVLLSGIQALVRLPIEQARLDRSRNIKTAGFISGYRGSPLGGLDKSLWQAEPFLKEHAIHFTAGINEDLAATSVWGSQQVNLFNDAKYDGVFGLWYGKGPGVDRSGDVFKHANAAGVSQYGGVLAIAGDDHACKSSTLPHQSDFAFIDAMMPVLAPANVQEVLDFGIYGWALSRYSGLWVGMKVLADIADSSMVVQTGLKRYAFHYPAFLGNPDVAIRWPDTPLDQEKRLHHQRIQAAQHFVKCNQLDRVMVSPEKAAFGIVVAGKSWLDTQQAMAELGLNEAAIEQLGIKIYKPAMVWPLEPERLKVFAEGLRSILVIEEKRPLLESQVKEILYNTRIRAQVFGRFGPDGEEWLPVLQDLNAGIIAQALSHWFAVYKMRIGARSWVSVSGKGSSETLSKASLNSSTERVAPDQTNHLSLQRAPHFCSGCPHNTSTRLPEGSRAGGGIGCHYMATWMGRGTETFTQMGGEGAPWIGQAPFTHTKHIFQNLGDGTYYHSGLLAIRAAIAAGVNITYKILYNDAVAMTGGQPVDGSLSVAQMTRQLTAEGVRHQVIVADDPSRHNLLNRLKSSFRYQDSLAKGVKVYHRDELISVEKQLQKLSGVSVLIYDQVCAAEKRRRNKKQRLSSATKPIPDMKVFINQSVCEGCGDCNVQSNCLSVIPVETERGRKRGIDHSSCNTDLSCINGFCPSFFTITSRQQTKFNRYFTALKEKYFNLWLSSESSEKRHSISKLTEKEILPEPECVLCEEPWNLVIAGVGGTGVVTVSALLATAAHIEGKGVFTLDQTGLAQKFGAVTSHVRIATEQKDIHAKMPENSAHLLLGMDMLVAASDHVVPYLSPVNTSAVVNIAKVMPADFINNRDLEFPAQQVLDILQKSTRQDQLHEFDAAQMSEKITGDAISANLILLGFTCQKGWLPVSYSSIEEAIKLNGISVDINLNAFSWGRRAALGESSLTNQSSVLVDTVKNEPEIKKIEQIVADEINWLTEYQDTALAERYHHMLKKIVYGEKKVSPGHQLAMIVAKNYSKVLAIKDEYEVARLFRKDARLKDLKKHYATGASVHFYLSPPILSRLISKDGKPGKIRLGGWMLPVFGLLEKIRGCRGKWYDPFLYTAENRFNRQLCRWYEMDLLAILTQLKTENYQYAIELASWPQEVRGFGYVKEGAFKKIQNTRFHLLRKIREAAATHAEQSHSEKVLVDVE